MKTMNEDDRRRHDFKNQLTIIRGFAEILLEEEDSDESRRRAVEEIHKAAVTALDLLQSLYPIRATNPNDA
jgi:signal transduction histidine kinase